MSEHIVKKAQRPVLRIFKDNICLQEVQLENNVVSIGRGAANQVRLGDITVSRNHARLLWREDRCCYFIEELHSTNGVYLNGRRIHGTVMLVDSDRFRLGVYDIVFVDRKAVDRWATTLLDSAQNKKAISQRAATTRLPTDTRRAILLREDNGGVLLLISDRVTIGKSENADIKVHGIGVESQQAVIARRGRRFYLLNNNDFPTVTINGRPVSNAQLEFNDRIEVGNSRFIFREI